MHNSLYCFFFLKIPETIELSYSAWYRIGKVSLIEKLVFIVRVFLVLAGFLYFALG